MSLLQNQVAIITGAGQGLGRAVAREFLAEGASVALIDMNPEALAETAQMLNTDKLRWYAFDITDYEQYARTVEAVQAWQGRIDVLVNNAGIATYGTLLDDTLTDWRRTMQVNLEAIYMGTKLVAPYMVAQRYGRVISIASVAGMASRGRVGSYNASKGAVIAYTKSLAVELAPYNILVNAVAPGFLLTPMLVDFTETREYREYYLALGKIPMGRLGLPEDVAGTVVFLASSYCRYMTGQTLIVDGGLMSAIV